MSKKEQKNEHPFGGVFGTIGAFVGMVYAFNISNDGFVALGGFIVGAWLGYIVEHLIFRLIVIGLLIIMIVARQAFFGAIWDHLTAPDDPYSLLNQQSAVVAMIDTAVSPAYSEELPTIPAKDDYVTCWKQPCIYTPASEWSEKNPNGVAVGVAMGTKPIATDGEIKAVITSDFKYYGVTNTKFFFEQNDAPATVLTFHIRGGTEGFYLVTEMRQHIPKLASRALNDNPLFSSSQ